MEINYYYYYCFTNNLFYRSDDKCCPVCGLLINSKRFNFKQHLKIHTGEKPFVCQVCNRAFRQKAHMVRNNIFFKVNNEGWIFLFAGEACYHTQIRATRCVWLTLLSWSQARAKDGVRGNADLQLWCHPWTQKCPRILPAWSHRTVKLQH